MSFPIFYRANFTQMVITLTSDESLGILNSQYLQDYYGVDGQLTLYNTQSQQSQELLVTAIASHQESASETPAIDNDVFRAFVPINALPNGVYELRGRCKDIVGNYTILSSFNNPSGNEKIVPLGFELTGGSGVFIADRILKIQGIWPIPMDFRFSAYATKVRFS